MFDEVTAGLDVHRALLKMDTQGRDLEVIAGALGILDRVVGVQSELSILPIYEEMPHFPVSRDRHLRLAELDYVLVRRS